MRLAKLNDRWGWIELAYSYHERRELAAKLSKLRLKEKLEMIPCWKELQIEYRKQAAEGKEMLAETREICRVNRERIRNTPWSERRQSSQGNSSPQLSVFKTTLVILTGAALIKWTLKDLHHK